MQRTQAVTPTRSARAAAREGSSAGFKGSVVDITNLRRWDHVAAATPSRPLQDHIASRIRLRRGSSAHVRQSSMLASQHDGQLAALLGRGGDQGVVGDERHVDLHSFCDRRTHRRRSNSIDRWNAVRGRSNGRMGTRVDDARARQTATENRPAALRRGAVAGAGYSPASSPVRSSTCRAMPRRTATSPIESSTASRSTSTGTVN
jgi:hypothetical protein